MGRVDVQSLKLWADLQADQVRLLEVGNGRWVYGMGNGRRVYGVGNGRRVGNCRRVC